jgi:sulfur carrier protein ThiS
MKLRVEYTAQLRTAAGRPADEIELPAGSRVAELLRHLADSLGESAAPHLLTSDGHAPRSLLVVVNGSAAPAQERSRIDDLLRWLAAHPWSVNRERSVVKPDAVEALHYVAIAGPIERARFMAMTGLPERTARRVLSSLLHFGVLRTTSSRAPVSFGVPLQSLRFLFPRLWPEAEADVTE